MTNPPDPSTPGYPQSPPPNYPQPQSAGHPQYPTTGHPAAPAGGYPQPTASGCPQHLWPEHARPQPPVHPSAQQPPRGPAAKGSAAMGVLALLLAVAGLVAPFLPFSNLIDRFPIRQYLAFPFALPAVALAIVTLAGPRRGKPAAAIGMMIAFLALAIGAIMIYNYDFKP